MNLSINDLFIAGILPGALMVLAMIIVAFIVSTLNRWGVLIRLDPVRVLKTALGGWLGFFAIGLVLWGIYTGKFSPTEAAGVTVGFCVVVGFICLPIYKMMNIDEERPVNERGFQEMIVVRGFGPRELPSITMRSAQITGILAPLIAISVVMQQNLSSLGAKAFIEGFLTSMGGYYPVLFTAMAIVFVAGMVLESLPVTIILAPILAPIAHGVGVDPIQFAVVFLVGASIGFITPPYGLNLYVASGVTGVPYFRLLRYSTLYLLALISVWLLVALVPGIATALLPGGVLYDLIQGVFGGGG